MPKEVEDAEILSKFQDERTRNEAFNLLLKKYQQKNILACAPYGY